MALTLSGSGAILPYPTTYPKHFVSSLANCVLEPLAVKFADLNLCKTSRMSLRCVSHESFVMTMSSWMRNCIRLGDPHLFIHQNLESLTADF